MHSRLIQGTQMEDNVFPCINNIVRNKVLQPCQIQTADFFQQTHKAIKHMLHFMHTIIATMLQQGT